MNINEGDVVYAIYQSEDKYFYRKEIFLKYVNGFPVCTLNMNKKVLAGYCDVCLSEKDAINRVSVLNSLNRR